MVEEALRAPRVIHVKVSQEHIRKGVKHDNTSCAIALALRDVGLPGWIGGGGMNLLRLPVPVLQFIHCFDDGKKVEPFSFDLTLPSKE